MKNIIKAEYYKLKRIKSLHLVYLFPLLLIMVALYDFIRVAKNMDGHSDPTIFFLSHLFAGFFDFFSPFFIAIIVFAIVQIEFKNKSWENLMLLTRSKRDIFFSKLLIVVSFTILYCVVAYIGFIAGKSLLSFIYPNLPFKKSPHNLELLILFLRYTIVFSMLAILFLNIFLYIQNPIIALGSVFFVLISSLFILNEKWSIYFPLTYSYKVSRKFGDSYFWNNIMVFSIIWIIVFNILGYLIFVRFWNANKLDNS